MTFLVVMVLSFYCMNFANTYEAQTCLLNDITPKASKTASCKFLKEMVTGNKTCPASEYDAMATTVADELTANKTCVKKTTKTTTASSTTSSSRGFQ